MEDDVLGADTRGQLAIDLYPHVLAPLGDEALGGKHVLDLAGADAKGEGAKGAMCRRVAVAADDCGTGEGEALLGADDVDNSLPLVAQAEICDAKVFDVLLEGDALRPRIILLDEARNVLEGFPRGGGDVLEGWPVRYVREGVFKEALTWSVVARVQSGRRTLRPAFLRPSKACCSQSQTRTGYAFDRQGEGELTGDVTSCTR